MGLVLKEKYITQFTNAELYSVVFIPKIIPHTINTLGIEYYIAEINFRKRAGVWNIK